LEKLYGQFKERKNEEKMKIGQVYSSPLWIGYRGSRVGYSHWRVQDATQNFVHRYVPFGRQHYYTRYNDFYRGWHMGYYNPFSLYY